MNHREFLETQAGHLERAAEQIGGAVASLRKADDVDPEQIRRLERVARWVDFELDHVYMGLESDDRDTTGRILAARRIAERKAANIELGRFGLTDRELEVERLR
jgi:hypothetical protein